MTDQFDNIRDIIAEDDIPTALEKLREVLVAQSRTTGPTGRRFRDLANEATVESGAWNSLARDRRRGTVDPAEIDRRERRTKVVLLDLIDAAEKAARKSNGPVAPATPPVQFCPPETSGLEKLWGRNTLQNVAWLEKGIVAAGAVCRVVTPQCLGTGFLIGGGRVITNNWSAP